MNAEVLDATELYQPGRDGRDGASLCRHCRTPLRHTFCDLGMSPLCESFLRPEQLNAMEPFYPLHARVCERCFLVQLQEYVAPESIFTEYAYFSSYADSWLAHARAYTEQMIERFDLTTGSQVIEIASNDGYLLQYFVARRIPALGIDPAANVAAVAIARGVPTMVRFFGRLVANELTAGGRQADLLIGNNVLAQVPDLNDFVSGLKILLKPAGIITLEFPHLLALIAGNQFDTIYHEHFSYFSFMTAEQIFASHGLTMFDVEEIPTHGGSLRIYARHAANAAVPVSTRVGALRTRERESGFGDLRYYASFDGRVRATKRGILDFLIAAKRDGRSIAGYGAPGKGNTLLNYCGIRTDFLDYTVDRNPYKHGKFTPGTHIPIFPPQKIDETRPDFVFVLPWNLTAEIVRQMQHIREWGGRFVVPVPELTVC